MKVFIINPDYPNRHKLLFPVPPLGLAYIAAVFQQEGFEIAGEDQFASGVSNKKLVNRIMAYGADIVAVGSLTPSINNACQIVALLRKKGFSGKIIMGGVHPSLFPQDLLRGGHCDIVVYGEGEETTRELCQAIKDNSPLDQIKGLIFLNDQGDLVENPGRPQRECLDSLPMPAWQIFDLNLYNGAPMLQVYGLALPVQGSRGCPRRCTFCGQEIFTPKVCLRSPESIVKEVEYLYEKHKLKYFIFVDANFPISEEYAYKFFEILKKSSVYGKVKWASETKVDLVNRRLLKAMSDSGCYLMEYGFESGDSAILKSIQKVTTRAHGLRAMKLTKESGIYSFGLFMIGLPGEGLKEIFKTFFYARKLDCDMAKFNIAIPQPGSPLFEKKREILLKDFHPETYSSWYRPKKGQPPMTTVSDIFTPNQLVILQVVGMLLFFLRPRLIFRHIFRGTLKRRDMIRGLRFLIEEILEQLPAFFASIFDR